MIVFLLSVLVCYNAGECQWQRVAYYENPQQCNNVALYYTSKDKRVVRYKCVVQARD